jgi:hypothetical protein
VSELEPDNAAGEVVEYTVRAPCRSCGGLYVWPKGSTAPGGVGPCCQPPLFDGGEGRALEPAAEERVDDEPERPPSRDLGHLGLDDVLCEGCRSRPADGRLTPGSALCVGCAEESVEHWLAWLEDPSHEWWPTDDVFGSARYPVRGWREMEVGS